MENGIFYICDGNREGCGKQTCYQNGGECKHTTNILYAKNFYKEGRSFREKETAPEN